MKRRFLHASPLAIGALAAATIVMAPAVAAPPKPIEGPQTTIYSDTFTPLKLKFPTPVKLVNHPHLVTALIMILEGTMVDVDGVTYTLRPTQGGDLTPTSETSSVTALPGWFRADRASASRALTDRLPIVRRPGREGGLLALSRRCV